MAIHLILLYYWACDHSSNVYICVAVVVFAFLFYSSLWCSDSKGEATPIVLDGCKTVSPLKAIHSSTQCLQYTGFSRWQGKLCILLTSGAIKNWQFSSRSEKGEHMTWVHTHTHMYINHALPETCNTLEFWPYNWSSSFYLHSNQIGTEWQ